MDYLTNHSKFFVKLSNIFGQFSCFQIVRIILEEIAIKNIADFQQ